MASISNPDNWITAGYEIAAGVGKTPFKAIMFDGSFDLLCGYGTSTYHNVHFIAQGMKVNKATGLITRGILGVVAPANYGTSNLETLIAGDPDYYYIVSVHMRNRESSATERFYLGLN